MTKLQFNILWTVFKKALPENLAKMAAGLILGMIISSWIFTKEVNTNSNKLDDIIPQVDTLMQSKQDYDTVLLQMKVLAKDVATIKLEVEDIAENVQTLTEENKEERSKFWIFIEKLIK